MGEESEVREPNGFIKSRTVLWYLTFVGFAVNYMIRINVNIAVVAMIDGTYKKSSMNTVITSECLDTNLINIDTKNWSQTVSHRVLTPLVEERKLPSIERRFLDYFEIAYERDGFKWDEHIQGLLLGSFYWLHWATQLPGGMLAQKYGSKLIFGLANVIGCLMCVLMPLASYWDYRALIFLRVIQGLICGLAWPAMHHLTASWIPPNERGKFVTAYLGSSVGVAIMFPVFGFIIEKTSWEYVFHFCGFFGTVWYIMWYFFVFDSPSKHPRIHPKEKEYILYALGSSVQLGGDKQKRRIPWRAILTSKPIWINTVAQWGGIWGLFTLLTQAPSYFRYVHGWGIEMTGLLSGIPHITRMAFALVFSFTTDYLLKTNKMTRTNVRKLGTFLCCIVNGFCVLGLAYAGCNSLAAVIFLTSALAVHGAVSSGPLASLVDIAPNYAGITLGLVGMITVIPGFVSPFIVSYLTFENQSIQQWKLVFIITSAMLIFCGTIFVAFSDSTLQSWNKIEMDGNFEENLQLDPENHQSFKTPEKDEKYQYYEKYEHAKNEENCDSEETKKKEQETLKIIE